MASRRPADRKSQIRSAAAALFLQRGYHNVSVADVAGRLDITASALYYHYRNKQDLLLYAVLDGVDAVGARIAAATTLDEALLALTTPAVAPPCLLTGWEREARYLPGPERAIVRAREAMVAAGLVRRLRAARPELGEADAELIAWAVLGVLGTCEPERSGPPRGEALLYQLGSVLAHCELPGSALPGDDGPQAALAPGPGSHAGLRRRRDQLLAKAIVLFDERGYQSVTTSERPPESSPQASIVISPERSTFSSPPPPAGPSASAPERAWRWLRPGARSRHLSCCSAPTSRCPSSIGT